MIELNKDWGPEVGDTCEAQIYPSDTGHMEWRECEVLKLNHNELHAVLAGDTLMWTKNLRPIKPEAEKRRDASVNEMLEIDPFGTMSRTDFCKKLHERGWRMTRNLTQRELTGDVIDKIWFKTSESGYSEPYYMFAKAIEAHIKGEA